MELHLKKGALHRDTGTPMGQKIPEAKIQAKLNSSNPLERKRAQFAENAKHWARKDQGH